LLRGEELTQPQVWHRDEKMNANGLFLIYPMSKNYSLYVIPESHKLDDKVPISSADMKKLLLNPGQLFMESSALVHAGGEVNPVDNRDTRVLKDGTKCFDIALHAYVNKGFFPR
jgi:hypothetical protein